MSTYVNYQLECYWPNIGYVTNYINFDQSCSLLFSVVEIIDKQKCTNGKLQFFAAVRRPLKFTLLYVYKNRWVLVFRKQNCCSVVLSAFQLIAVIICLKIAKPSIHTIPTFSLTCIMFNQQRFFKLVPFFENLSNSTSPFEKPKQHQ